MTSHPVRNRVEKPFWEDEYLANVPIPARPDEDMAFERCLARALAEHAPVPAGARVLEVGCAPGKWLVFYAERFGASVVGVEYTDKGAELTRANFAATGIPGEVVQGDFFALPSEPFDLVLSLGFIEHFDDLDATFARHLDFVAPGGRLAIGVPNYRGLNRMLQRWSDPEHLALHNLEAMRPGRYRDYAASHGLTLEHLGHLGGPDPIIIKIGRRSTLLVTLLEGRLRRLAVAERLDHPWLSSYLLAVFRRPPGDR
jgi:SAM-dependent methyltransferase